MHKNPLFLTLLAILGSITIGYALYATHLAWCYTHLTASTVPVEMKWKLERQAEDRIHIDAHFQYQVGGKIYRSHERDSKGPYRNLWVAEERQQELEQTPITVWFDPAQPARSTLQKSFPLKECVSAAVLLALLLYFVGVGWYVAQKQGRP